MGTVEPYAAKWRIYAVLEGPKVLAARCRGSKL